MRPQTEATLGAAREIDHGVASAGLPSASLTCSSVVCEKSSYHAPTAVKGSDPGYLGALHALAGRRIGPGLYGLLKTRRRT